MPSPGPQFSDIVRNYLTTYINPRTATGGSGRDGGYSDNTPPPSIATFRSRLDDEAKAFSLNDWELGSFNEWIDFGEYVYTAAFRNWVLINLAGDAPSSVVKWQADERAKLKAA